MYSSGALTHSAPIIRPFIERNLHVAYIYQFKEGRGIGWK